MMISIRNGGFLMLFSFLYALFYHLVKTNFGGVWSLSTFDFLYPDRLTFLLPGYTGILIILIGFLYYKIDFLKHYSRLDWSVSIFGRTSLFTFVIQFAITWSIPKLLGLEYRLNGFEFVLAFIIMLVTCWMMAYFYGRIRGWIKPNDYSNNMPVYTELSESGAARI